MTRHTVVEVVGPGELPRLDESEEAPLELGLRVAVVGLDEPGDQRSSAAPGSTALRRADSRDGESRQVVGQCAVVRPVHHVGQVDERARDVRHAERERAEDVDRRQVPRAVDDDVVPAVRRQRGAQMHQVLWGSRRGRPAVEGRSRVVGQNQRLTARPERGEPAGLVPQGRVPEGVDTAVDTVQAARPLPAADGSRSEATVQVLVP